MASQQNVSKPSTFDLKKINLLKHVAHKTCQTPKLYATGVLQLSKSRAAGYKKPRAGDPVPGSHPKLHGSAQCTRDLSCDDCKLCLPGTISVNKILSYSTSYELL